MGKEKGAKFGVIGSAGEKILSLQRNSRTLFPGSSLSRARKEEKPGIEGYGIRGAFFLVSSGLRVGIMGMIRITGI